MPFESLTLSLSLWFHFRELAKIDKIFKDQKRTHVDVIPQVLNINSSLGYIEHSWSLFPSLRFSQ